MQVPRGCVGRIQAAPLAAGSSGRLLKTLWAPPHPLVATWLPIEDDCCLSLCGCCTGHSSVSSFQGQLLGTRMKQTCTRSALHTQAAPSSCAEAQGEGHSLLISKADVFNIHFLFRGVKYFEPSHALLAGFQYI